METIAINNILNIQNLRQDFPILSKKANGRSLVYLDTGATA
ncbi:MAG: selenocysteine lyase/cysteine desulfurase [Sediminicola sp.]|jgi:selenocysteine lyase/cysteine desulfurase